MESTIRKQLIKELEQDMANKNKQPKQNEPLTITIPMPSADFDEPPVKYDKKPEASCSAPKPRVVRAKSVTPAKPAAQAKPGAPPKPTAAAAKPAAAPVSPPGKLEPGKAQPQTSSNKFTLQSGLWQEISRSDSDRNDQFAISAEDESELDEFDTEAKKEMKKLEKEDSIVRDMVDIRNPQIQKAVKADADQEEGDWNSKSQFQN